MVLLLSTALAAPLSGTDCHMHLRPPESTAAASAEAAIAALDAAGIERGCALSPGYRTADGTLEATRAANDWTLAQAATHPRLLAFCGVPTTEESSADEVKRCAAAGAAGIKVHPASEKVSLADPKVVRTFGAVLQAAGKAGIPVLVHPPADGIDALFDLARAHPETTVIAAHQLGAFFTKLAEAPDNVWTEISGLTLAPPEAGPAFVEVWRAMGIDRVMLGSDWPMLDPTAHLAALSTFPLTEAELDAIVSGNAQRLWPPRDAFVLENVRVVDALGERTVAELAVLGERIVAVGEADPARATWRRIDATGTTVVPGLVDAHVHLSLTPGGAFLDLTEAEETDLWRQHLAAYVASGVVAVLDTGILPGDAATMQQLAREGPSPTVRFLGPLVSPPGGYVHAVLPEFPPAPDVATLQAQLEAFDALDPIGVKVTFEDGMARPIWPLLADDIREALKAQPRPLFAHAMEPHEYREALELGVKAFVHPPDRPDAALIAALKDIPVVTTLSVMDMMLTPSEPERTADPLVKLTVPSVEQAAAVDPERIHASYDGVTRAIVPKLPGVFRGMVIKLLASPRQVGKRLKHLQNSVLALHEAGVTLVAGSDSGNWPLFLWAYHGPTSVRELELLQAAGIPPADVLRIGTLNGAQLLGLQDEIGTIEVGKRASFIIVDGDPLQDIGTLRSARWVVLDGVVRTPSEWVGGRGM